MGVDENLEVAFKNYVKASLWGDKEAVYEVYRCLYYGIGVPENKELSYIWLERFESLE